MEAPRRRWIPVEQAKIDTVYEGYRLKGETSYHLCDIRYKGNGTAWIFEDKEHPVNNIEFVQENLSYKEIEEWYKNHFDISNPKVKNNLLGLFTDLYDVGDARHEMWNAWIGIDWYEMSAQLFDEDFYLVGIADAPWGKTYLDEPTVAYVAETYDGKDKFWCHGTKSSLEDMREQMLETYEKLKKEIYNE